MTIAQLKTSLTGLEAVRFRLPSGEYLPDHFHVTEVGLSTKHFIDCGGTERKESYATLQLWEAGDYDHRLGAQKFLDILGMSGRILGSEDLEIDVEYQQATIGRFGLTFDGNAFELTPKQTACLALDACGVPASMISLAQSITGSACTPGGGCC